MQTKEFEILTIGFDNIEKLKSKAARSAAAHVDPHFFRWLVR